MLQHVQTEGRYKEGCRGAKVGDKKAKVPSAKYIQKWIEEIINKIWLLTNITIKDKNVMKELEGLALHKNDTGLF